MSADAADNVALLLDQLSRGDQAAAGRLLPVIYDELRALAGSFLRAERPDHTLQPTALVHEVYLKLVGQSQLTWANRAHFVAVAASAMRRILADSARRHRAAKRGGGWHKITLDEAVAPAVGRDLDLVDLDEALARLASLDERKSRVVELRFFGGLTNSAVAEVLGVSRKTVADDWTVARLWLRRELAGRADA
ncbi:MAG TPA: sigma-70 family RNA polymerase sigma factor [Phycisphaerae bacterium]|nr:sigma-70 family RNA polymerase sigma factor [Phycisphaerae bacterium]HNU44770.1 sigma-70 family RNA polymerase sigma factor [Phycisphaerae bacterium]